VGAMINFLARRRYNFIDMGGSVLGAALFFRDKIVEGFIVIVCCAIISVILESMANKD
jgi:hypothetical protein